MKRILALSFILLLAACCSCAGETAQSRIMVIGGVNMPGVYPFEPGLTYQEIVSLAGGLRGRPFGILVVKPDSSILDLTDELDAPDFWDRRAGDVGPGDTLFVVPRLVKRDFKDVPFATALDSILKDTGISYSLCPELKESGLTVTAVLKNVTLDSALKILMSAAGASYELNGNVLDIKPALMSSYTNTRATAVAVDTTTESELIMDKIPLNFVQAGDVLPLLKYVSGLISIDTVGTGSLWLRGSEDAIDQAKKIIRAVDSPDAYPRPVRTTVELVITGPNGKRYSVATEMLGPESVVQSSAASLALPISKSEKGNMKLALTFRADKIGFKADGPLLPASGVPPPCSISVAGKGKISGRLPVGEFSQEFDFAVSVLDGGPPVTVTLSKLLGTTSVAVRISARIEEGHVKLISEADHKMMEDSAASTITISGPRIIAAPRQTGRPGRAEPNATGARPGAR